MCVNVVIWLVGTASQLLRIVGQQRVEGLESRHYKDRVNPEKVSFVASLMKIVKT